MIGFSSRFSGQVEVSADSPGKFGESARFEHNHKTSHNHVF